MHVLGGSLLLGGTLWHLSAGGSLAFDQFGSHASANLVLVAFLLSAAMPPLHPWLPDAYPSASIAGTVLLSAFTTKSAVYALLRGFPGTDILIVLGVAMAFYGVIYAVLENDVRRLLSYHIVSQVGFMVTAVGIGTAAAVNGATAHAFAHILYKGLLLMGVGALIHATGKEKLTDMGGLARKMPWVMVLYMVGAFSISGVPLFSGFVSKELVIDAAYGDGRELVVYLLKVVSVGTFLSTALKLPWFAWGGPDRGLTVRSVPATMMAAMGLTAAANVVLGLRPSLLYDLMPNPVDYEPFTTEHFSETIQLLVLTALGFWLLATKLKGEPSITLDTDWLYRRAGPRLVASGRAMVASAPSPLAGVQQGAARLWFRATDGTLGTFTGLGRRDLPPTATPVLGAIMLVAILVFLSTALVG
jgi:multicomponent Na+:H+ antiporter subunit D